MEETYSTKPRNEMLQRDDEWTKQDNDDVRRSYEQDGRKLKNPWQ